MEESMKMKMILLAGLILAMAVPIAAAEEDPACSLRLGILDKEIWTLTVESDRIKGDKTMVRQIDEVAFGFVGGKKTRLRFEEKSVEGRLADVPVKLALTRGDEHIELRGSAGGGHLSAKATGDELVLANQRIVLTLKTAKDPAGKTVLRDAKGQVSLAFAGCGLGIVRDRPELLLVLSEMVLSRVASFQDAL
jgi:hypothetical protein